MRKPRHPSAKKQLSRAIFVASQYSQPLTTLALVGSVLASAVLFATGISLAYSSTPVKSIERLSSGAITSKLALAGKSCVSHRLSGSLKNLAVTGTTRATHRLSSGFLGGKTSLAGNIRDNDRLTGATLGFQAGHQLITGTTRDSARLLSTAISLNYSATPSRSRARLQGALLGGKVSLAGTIRGRARDLGLLGFKLPLTGTIRASDRSYAVSSVQAPSALRGTAQARARLKGALLTGKVALTGKLLSSVRESGQLQFQGTTTSVTGTIRARGVLKSTGISLAYAATPSKSRARLTGATLGFVTGKTFVSGTSRDAERLTGRLGLVYDLAPIQVSPRVKNAVFSNKLPILGTLRSGDRLRGANLSFSGTVLVGTTRDSERLRGALLGGKVSLIGTSRDTTLLQDAALTSKLALTGISRAPARDTATLHFLGTTPLAGTSIEESRLKGSLLTGKTALAGTIRDEARLSSAFLGGKTSLAGTLRSLDRLQGAAFSIRIAIAGKSRSSGYLIGAPLLLKSTLGMSGRSVDYFRLRGASLAGKSFLVGSVKASGLAQDALLGSYLPVAGMMRGTSARLVNGLNPVGEPYRIIDSGDHAVIFVASDRVFTMTFEKT